MRNLYLGAILVAALFVWTRTYQITESLNFFNDIGRDFLVLWQWRETGKPPLLGPQTSALPFNQSAIYFYLLFPFYWLSGGSVYASLYAYLFVYLAAFALGLYALRAWPRLERSLLLVFLLITVHPEYIVQGRFVWNPSFVTPALLAAFYSLMVYLEQKHPQPWLLFLAALGLSAATAFSYSALPALIALSAYLLYRRPQLWRQWLPQLVLAMLLVNLPTLVFELRHQFLLSKMLLFGEAASHAGNEFWTRLTRLLTFVFSTHWSYGLAATVATAYFAWRSHKYEPNRFLVGAGVVLGLTFILTIFAPVSVHSHYIFPVLSLLFVLLSFLRPAYLYLLGVFFYVVFLTTALRLDFFAPARHSVSELQACAAAFCQAHPDPLFVSNQSAHHPYHNAMEWQYLLSASGCQLRQITEQPTAAELMAVVVDDDVYVHGQTAYHELTLFGSSQELSRFICQDDLELVLLQRQ